MKIKDVQSATALIIQGFLRANDEGDSSASRQSQMLFDCLSGIRQEVGDWAENLPIPVGKDGNALEPVDIEVGLTIRGAEVSRTPYNLVSAAVELLREAVDLNGPEAVLSDFQRRGGVPVGPASVRIDDLHKSTHPVALANAGSWLKKNGGPVAVRRPLKIEDAIYEASCLAKEIDAETETRPAEKIARWEALCADLRTRGVAVEDRVVCPANW